ncbi:MAG TPA: phosphatidate cytidylyltransferase, partial [Stenotrophomonas sp.]|nr:phosphatidate cytidylyltransferase [Stenotrophomonas sp.]
MTKTRVIAALIMAPVAICAILLLPSQWLAAAAALVFLTGLWEWLRLAGVDGLPRTVLLVLNLLLMVLLVWASAGSLVLFQLATLAGVGFWLLALLWLRFFDFGAHEESGARMLKLAAGTLAIVPAWAALVLIHAGQPHGNRWLLTALAVVWAADSGAYFAGRAFGRRKLAPRVSPNKTIEGLLGGLVAGLVVAVGFGWLAGVQPAAIGWLVLGGAVTGL